MKVDKHFFGDGISFEISPDKTGMNANAVVVGPTGAGKTFSFVLPMILNNNVRSMVIPVSKPEIIKACAKILIEHGYKISVLDFARDKSTTGFNLFVYMRTEEDIREFADAVVEEDHDAVNGSFWTNSAKNLLVALVSAMLTEGTASIGRLKELLDQLFIRGNMMSTNFTTGLDAFFEEIIGEDPDGVAAICWNEFKNNTANVAKDIKSTLAASVRSLFVDRIIELSDVRENFDIRSLGHAKRVLFVVSHSTNRSIDKYINILYRYMIRELIEEAYELPDATLPVPVELVFDDFAGSTIIRDFDGYISIFRSAGISSVILLQCESQLYSKYGEAAATTILNNIDSYVYLGGNDSQTCRKIAERLDKPVSKIYKLPLEKVIIMRRGSEPVVADRYKTLEDPNYIKYIAGGRNNER